MNKLLQDQLQKYLGETGQITENLMPVFTAISDSYDLYEKDHERTNMLEKEKDESKEAYTQLIILLEDIDEVLYSVNMVSLKMSQISSVCEKVYGYTPTEFLADGDLWQKVILPEDIHIVYEHIKELYEGKQVMGQYRIFHKDKSIRWLESKIIPTLDKTGQLMRIDGVTNDITERKRAEKELEESVSLLEATIESTADGILVADFNGKIVRFNKKFAELSRIPSEILETKDEEKAMSFVFDQLANPGEFISKIKELYVQKEAVSFDIIKFKDDRVFERYSQPQLIKGKCIGRVWSFRDITDSKIAEDKIRESELRYRSLIEEATDAICITDASLKFYDMNPSGCRMLGYSKEEFLKLSVDDLFFTEDLVTNPFKIEELKSGKTIRSDRRFKRKDGTIIDVDLSGKLLEDGRFIMFGRNISERKQAEKLIKESELRYRSLIEQASDAICIADSSMKLHDINSSGMRLFGYSKEEFLQLSVIDLFLLEELSANPFKIDKLKSGESISDERRFKRKDGTMVDVEVNAKVLEDGRFMVIGRDISERKRAEKLIKESELRYRSLIEQATDAICIADRSLKFIDINPSGSALLGYSKEDFLQLSVGDILPIEDTKTNPLKIEELKSGKTIRNERKIIRKDGTIADAEVSGKILEDGRFIIFGRDISERKQTEKLLKESELRYRNLIEQATDAICIADQAMKFIDVNRYACESLGYSKEEALQLSVTDILFTEDLALNPFKYDVVQPGEIIRNERRLKRKDGTSVIMEVSTRLTEDGRFIMFGHDISDRKKSEEALRESEKRLRQIIDLVPHFIFAKDANGKFILANQTVARAYGCAVEDLIGKADADFNKNKEEVEYFKKEDSEVISKGIAKYNIEETITDATDNVRILSTTKIPYTSPGYDIPGVLGVSVDITERKKAEIILKENETQLSIATQIAKLGYWEFDVSKKLFSFNDQFYSIFKTTADQAGGYLISGEKYVNHFVHPDDVSIVIEAAKEAIQSPDPGYNNQIEYRIKYADGEIGYITAQYFIIKNKLGQTIKVFGAIQEITETRRAEAVLKENEGQLAIAAQIAKLGYWEFDVMKGLFTFNDQFYAIFKTTAEQLGGYTMTPDRYSGLFVHPEDAPIVGKEVADAINSSDPNYNRQIEHRIIYANGQMGHMAVRFFIVKDELGRTIKTFGVNQDISDRKKGEDTLRISEAKLELKNKELEHKNKELEQFAYVASHDLQEPLRTTSSFAELLQQQYKGKLDEKADKYLTFINQSSDRMKVLIKDLLDYSRIGRKKELEPVDCNTILKEVVADLNTIIGEVDAKIDTEKLPVVHGYPTELKQLFQNLVTNAIKFRKKNITPQINISVKETDGYWQFAVKDNGIGIEEQHNSRIFDIFQRLHTRTEYEGSGIGLSNCKKIVELHEGKIWVESISGNGSTFYFTLQQNNV